MAKSKIFEENFYIALPNVNNEDLIIVKKEEFTRLFFFVIFYLLN